MPATDDVRCHSRSIAPHFCFVFRAKCVNWNKHVDSTAVVWIVKFLTHETFNVLRLTIPGFYLFTQHDVLTNAVLHLKNFITAGRRVEFVLVLIGNIQILIKIKGVVARLFPVPSLEIHNCSVPTQPICAVHHRRSFVWLCCEISSLMLPIILKRRGRRTSERDNRTTVKHKY